MVKLTKFHKMALGKVAKANGVEPDTYDFEANWDSSLTLEENYSKIKSDLSRGAVPEYDRQEHQRFEDDQLNMALDHELEAIRANKSPVDSYYTDLKESVFLFSKTNDFHLLTVSGVGGGEGKTFQVKAFLTELGIPFSYNCGHCTPYQLFRILHEDYDKVVVFDDCNPILENSSSVALLLQACDTRDVRVVMWNTSKKTDIAKRFEFRGKVVIITNKPLGDLYEPLLTRALKCEVNFDNVTMLKVVAELAKSKPYGQEIIDLLKAHIGDMRINLRLFKMLCATRDVYEQEGKPGRFAPMAEFIIRCESNPNLKEVHDLLKASGSVKTALKQALEKGIPRRDFYRHKKEVDILWKMV